MNDKGLIIADGNRDIGYGHISRCLNLANVFKRNNFDVHFLQKKDSTFNEKIKEKYQLHKVQNYALSNSKEIEKIIKENNIGYVVIDLLENEYLKLEWLRYKFPNLIIATITLFLFDLDKRYEDVSFYPDIYTVLEENKMNKYGKYEFYAGPDYLMFRDEFNDLKKTIRKRANQVLVTMGGSDPFNISLKIVQSVKKYSDFNFKIILSEIAKSFESVNVIADKYDNITLINGTNRISKLMSESDLVILNGGLTRYEVCLTKTPFIAISIHEKQFNITKRLTDLGVGVNLGIYNEIDGNRITTAVINLLNDYSKRKKMSLRMKDLFDTKGAERIFKKIVGC